MTPDRISKRIPVFLSNNRLALFLAAICIFISLQPLKNQLIWDDAYLIRVNPDIGIVSKLWETVSRPFWHNSVFTHTALTGFWRPVTSFTFWLTGFFSKSAWLFHLTGVLATLATAILAGRTAREWFDEHISGTAIFVACSLYFLHPVTAETYCMVANISDHLTLIFFFLCLLLSIRFCCKPTFLPWLPLIFVLAFLSCGSKEFGIMVAIIPLLAWVWNKYRNNGQPFPATKQISLWLAIVTPVIVYLVLRHQIISNDDFTAQTDWSGLKVATFITGIGVALKQVFYLNPFPTDIAATPLWLYYGLAALTFMGLALLIWYGIYRNRNSLVSASIVILFLGMLLPSFFTVIPNQYGILEFPSRYFHFSVLCVTLSLVRGHQQLLRTVTGKAVIIVIALMLASQSYMRIRQWEDAITLFSEDVRLRPSSEKSVVSLAESFLDVHAFTEAEHLIQAFKGKYEFVTPFYRAYSNSVLSQVAFLRDGNIRKAIPLAKKAIEDAQSTPLFILRLVNILELSHHRELAIDILNQALNAENFSSQQRVELQSALSAVKSNQVKAK